jgi:NitT/TauT family transport system substrate-binding protein
MTIFACCYRSFALEYEVKTRNIRGTSIAAVAALLAVAGCSGSSGGASGGLEKTNIVVDAFGAIDSAGLFIAQQDGLFKAQGLNVTVNLTTKSQDAVDGQLSGKYDITSADYVTYVDNVLLKKAPLRIVAESSFLQPNVLTLLVKPGSGVKSVAQLRHGTVSVNAPNDIGTVLIDSVLTENGIPLNTVKFNNNVIFPNVGTALHRGIVDAAFAPEPFVSLNEFQGGAQELADLDEGGAKNFPIQGVAVTQKWAQDNPKTLAAFERAYAQGQQIADTDRAAVENALEKFLQMPPLAAALISLPNFPIGVDSVRLQRLVDAMVRFHLLGQQFRTFKISSIIGDD